MTTNYKIRKLFPIYLMAFPAFIWFIIFVYYPAILGFIVSFQKFHLISKNEFIGFENYIKVFNTPNFWNVLINTFVIGIFTLALNVACPIIVALLLNEITRNLLKRFVQTSIFIAHLFSWVAIAGIWIYVLALDKGFLNIFLEHIGLHPIPFMSSMKFGKPLVIFLIVWKEVGYLSILYLASITTINPELYEAAVIDGASRFKQALSITIPSLVPTIKVLIILGITEMFKLFDPIWVLRNPGNSQTIDTVMIYVKLYGIDRFQFGYTSAISVLIFLAILIITIATKQGLKYRI